MSSCPSMDTPVTLPPGRARLCTSPAPRASPAGAMTMGTVVVASFAARMAVVPCVTMTSTFRWSSSATSGDNRSGFASAYAPVERDVLPFDPSQLAHPRGKNFSRPRVGRRPKVEPAYTAKTFVGTGARRRGQGSHCERRQESNVDPLPDRHVCPHLCAPCTDNAACQRRRALRAVGCMRLFGTCWKPREGPRLDHWITWSARASTDCGIVRPRALAALRLMTSSNFVGCSIGRSPGFAPLRILST